MTVRKAAAVVLIVVGIVMLAGGGKKPIGDRAARARNLTEAAQMME